jgi:3-hydroxybutyrate dehydrogenase
MTRTTEPGRAAVGREGAPSPARLPALPDLSGRRAVVTGGASGIGRACVRRLAASGAEVLVLDIAERGARQSATEAAGDARAIDLADLDAVDALDLRADVLVNNAGLQHVAPIESFPPEVFGRMMRIMVEAPFRLVRQVLPGMYAAGWGRIINITSVHGMRASPYKSAYVTAKHALEGLSKVIALEGAAHGVTANCVSPAYVRTPLVEHQIAAQAEVHGMAPDDVVDRVMLARAAVKRLIEPDEVAGLVAYLCAPEAASITGVTLTMDGGWTAQ